MHISTHQMLFMIQVKYMLIVQIYAIKIIWQNCADWKIDDIVETIKTKNMRFAK